MLTITQGKEKKIPGERSYRQKLVSYVTKP